MHTNIYKNLQTHTHTNMDIYREGNRWGGIVGAGGKGRECKRDRQIERVKKIQGGARWR